MQTSSCLRPRCPASAPRKATVCAEPVTGNGRGRLGSSLGHASGHSKPIAREKKARRGRLGSLGKGQSLKVRRKRCGHRAETGHHAAAAGIGVDSQIQPLWGLLESECV